jgi:carbonic anhydrase
MDDLKDLLAGNKRWAEKIKASDPDFFNNLTRQQTPRYLWIGCSDSRVPSTQLVGLQPGDMFVHRNVANVIVHTDFNFLSVLQYAVDVLKVHHIIVCGHDGCGGLKAAMENSHLGLIDNWLRHVQDVITSHQSELSTIVDAGERLNRLGELNVIEQVINVSRTTIVQNAWNRGQELAVHGLIYKIGDGLLRDLNVRIRSEAELSNATASA